MAAKQDLKAVLGFLRSSLYLETQNVATKKGQPSLRPQGWRTRSSGAVDVSPRFVWVGSLTAAQSCQELQQIHFLTSPAPAPLSPARATHDRHLAAASDACELRDSRGGDPLPRRPPGPRRPLRRTRAPAPREPGRAGPAPSPRGRRRGKTLPADDGNASGLHACGPGDVPPRTDTTRHGTARQDTAQPPPPQRARPPAAAPAMSRPPLLAPATGAPIGSALRSAAPRPALPPRPGGSGPGAGRERCPRKPSLHLPAAPGACLPFPSPPLPMAGTATASSLPR